MIKYSNPLKINWVKAFMLFKKLRFTLLGVGCVLLSCQKQPSTEQVLVAKVEPVQTSEEQSWVNEEILNQLVAMRKDISGLRKEVAALNKANGVETMPEIELVDKRSVGNKTARVAIVEFTDYQCHFCKRHQQGTFEKIKKSYVDTGIVNYQIRDYPLAIHPQAQDAAVAAYCAGEQNKYWEMHNQLFAYGKTMSDAFFMGSAKSLGLNEAGFKQCFNSKFSVTAVKKDLLLAKELGITSTPAFYVGLIDGGKLVNGVKITGAQPFSVFERAITRMQSKL